AALTAGIERLEATDHRLGSILDTGETLTALRERWQTLQQRIPALAVHSGDMPEAEVMNALQALIAHVGDTSNLILDPDLDSYYLMDATLLKLPEVEDLLVQAGRL